MNKVCHLVQMDAAFRERLQTDPTGALADLPLTDEERQAFVDGDIATLYRRGANTFMMSRLQRFGVFGLDVHTYNARMRRAVETP